MQDFEFNASSSQNIREIRWVNIDGVPVQGEAATIPSIDKRLNSGAAPPLSQLRLRDPEYFSVGSLHGNVDPWRSILVSHSCLERILDWLTLKVDIREFKQPFRGS